MKDPIEIYVACLASYNDGILHGQWIDATDVIPYRGGLSFAILHGQWIDATADLSDIREAIASILKTSPIPDAEEWAIHDYSGFGSLRLGEYESLSRVSEIARLLDRHGNLAFALLDHYDLCTDTVKQVLESGNCLEGYTSAVDYAREVMQETGEIPTHLASYIDYKAIARDMDLSGDLLVLEFGGETYILLNP